MILARLRGKSMSSNEIGFESIQEAAKRIAPYIREDSIFSLSIFLSITSGKEVWLKCESLREDRLL